MIGLPIRQRWKDARPAAGGRVEVTRAGVEELFAKLRPAQGLSDAQLGRVWSHVAARASAGPGSSGAVATGLKLLGIALAVGTVASWLALHGAAPDRTPESAPALLGGASAAARSDSRMDLATNSKSGGEQPREAVAAAAPAGPQGAVAASAERSRAAGVRRSKRSQDVPASSPLLADSPAPPRVALMSVPPEDRIADEAKLLERAIEAARGERDPEAALAALDLLDGQFPHGRLAREALLVRIEALVELGDRGALLGLLDARTDPDAEVDAPLRVLRAEVLAELGRYAEALRAFEAEAARAGTVGGAIAERVLYGRAVALAALGRHGESKDALREYLQRFPEGRYARLARLVLGK